MAARSYAISASSQDRRIPFSNHPDGTFTASVRNSITCPGEAEPSYGEESDETEYTIAFDDECEDRCVDAPESVSAERGGNKSTWTFTVTQPTVRAGKETPTHTRYVIKNQNGSEVASGQFTNLKATVTTLDEGGQHTDRSHQRGDQDIRQHVRHCDSGRNGVRELPDYSDIHGRIC